MEHWTLLFYDLYQQLILVADPGGKGAMLPPPPDPPAPVKNSHKNMAAKHDSLYFMFVVPPPLKFLDPLLNSIIESTELGRWHNGSAFVFCLGYCPFKSEPSPTSGDAWGEVTGCDAGNQEVSKCSTRGGSQGMHITFTSAKKWIRQNPLCLWNLEMSPEIQPGVPVAPKKDMCPPKTFVLNYWINMAYNIHCLLYTRNKSPLKHKSGELMQPYSVVFHVHFHRRRKE